MLRVAIIPADHPSGKGLEHECRAAASRAGALTTDDPAEADLCFAPLLQRILRGAELEAPRLGWIIHHPSALPVGRGPDAIRHTIARGERVSAATWFYASRQLDGGEIADQELVILPESVRPAVAYQQYFAPAAAAAFTRMIDCVVYHGLAPLKRDQDRSLATYDSHFKGSVSVKAAVSREVRAWDGQDFDGLIERLKSLSPAHS